MKECIINKKCQNNVLIYTDLQRTLKSIKKKDQQKQYPLKKSSPNLQNLRWNQYFYDF